jgi:hypothetical protein
MKYTKFLIYGDFFNTKNLESMPIILFPLTLGAVVLGFVIVTGALPLSVTADGLRSIKYKYLLFERKHRIVRSLTKSRPYVFLKHRNTVIVHGIVHEVQNFTNVLKKIA